MPLIKAGKIWYNGVPGPAYLLVGVATKNAEDAPINGKDHAKVSIAAGETENGESLYVTVNGWRARAKDVLVVAKGDSVLAFGKLQTREYKEKLYYDLDCDFIVRSGYGTWTAGNPVAFEELEDDDETGLPWDQQEMEDELP